MNTSSRRILIAITLLTGFNLSATAGLVSQDVTPSARLGSSPLAGWGSGTAGNVVAMPAQILPLGVQPLPAPFVVPMPAALDAPAAIPEPGTVATLAAGLALMAALARRRRPR